MGMRVCVEYDGGDDAVEQGARIAQLVIEAIATPVIKEVTDLPTTKRGAGGFGSTGIM